MPRWKVWGYEDGTLLRKGFEAEAETDDGALVPALIALLDSCGIEACMALDGDESVNTEVKSWEDVSERPSTEVS